MTRRRPIVVGGICFLLGAITAAMAATAIRPDQFVGLPWTWSAVQTFLDGKLVVSGASSGSSTIKAPATGGGTVTLPAGDGTLSFFGGTVTSVGFSVPASSIFGTSGSPVTVSGTLGLTTIGTSGGIPYFDTTSTLSSSGALTNHAIVLGGGSGGSPTALGSLGTSTTLLHGAAAGAPTFGAVVTGDITNSSVTYAKVQDVAASSLVGNPTGSSAAPSEITLGTGLAFSGTTLIATGAGFGTVTSVTCGTGLSGGTFTTTGTCSLDTANANTWSAVQQFNSGDFKLNGATSGTITLNAAAMAGSNTLTLPAGTTDFSGTGGTSQVVKQTSSGGAFTVARLACSDLSDSASACSTSTGTSGATIPLLNGANTWSGVQSVNDGDLALKGSSSGTTTLKAAAAAGTTTITFPAATDTAAVLGTAQTWTATQSSTPQTLTISTATFTPAVASGNNIKLTLVHASCPCTFANWSGTPIAGTSGVLEIIQSATGSDTIGTWGSQYVSAGGTSTLTLSTAANAIDFYSYYVIDSTHTLISSAALNAVH